MQTQVLILLLSLACFTIPSIKWLLEPELGRALG
jgi:hypothetical protein